MTEWIYFCTLLICKTDARGLGISFAISSPQNIFYPRWFFGEGILVVLKKE